MTNPFSKDFSAVKRLKNGDQQAFEELYEKYFRLVKHVIYQIINNDMISEDLTQETFLRMYESISSFENNISFSAWLCTIGRNLALNEKKKRQREMEWKDYDKTDETSNPQEESQKKEDLERIKSFLPEKITRLSSTASITGYRTKKFRRLQEKAFLLLPIDITEP